MAKYPDLEIQETLLEAHIRDVINSFVRTGSVNKEKSPRRPSASEVVVNHLREQFEQNPQTSLIRLQSGVPVAKIRKREWTSALRTKWGTFSRFTVMFNHNKFVYFYCTFYFLIP